MNRTSLQTERRCARRGIVLLMVLGVLALMSVLVISFVSMARMERAISANYVAYVRAQMTAESGVEKAISEVSRINGKNLLEELERMRCGPGEDPRLTLAEVQVPSYAVDVDGDLVPDAFSGAVGSSQSDNGDRYKLRVEDESAKFNLNDTPGSKLPQRMFRVVETLVSLLFDGDPRLPVWATDVAIAVELARAQAGGRFSAMTEVRAALTEGATPLMDADEWRLLESNLTIYSWQDPNTLLPNPPFNRPVGVPGVSDSVMNQTTAVAPNDFNYKLPTPTMVDRYGDDVYTMGMFQMRELELEPRAPVNINAASQELIAALIEGIQGYYIFDYGYMYDTNDTFQLATLKRHDFRCPSQDDGYTMGYHIMYGWAHPAPYIASFNRNYRPILFSNKQYDSATYEFNGIEEFSQYGLWNANFATDFHARLAGCGLGALKKSVAVNRDLALRLADLIYRRIHAGSVDVDGNGSTADAFEAQNPFRTWQEFQGFVRAFFGYDTLDARVPKAAGSDPDFSNYMRRSMADAILANFNPNSDLIDYNPNKTLHKLVDKGHLVNDLDPSDPDATQGYSTEFCFEPTGVFSVESLGRVYGAADEIMAEAMLKAKVEVWRPWRITSQAQFLGLGSTSPLTSLNDLDEFFFANAAGVLPAAGAESGVVGAAGYAQGYTCTTFPEAVAYEFNPATQTYGGIDFQRLREAIYDGYVMPSTWQENLTGDPQELTFRACFNGKLDADSARFSTQAYYERTGTVPAGLIPEQADTARLMIPRSVQEAAMTAAGDTAPALQPGSLRAEGAYSEAHRTLIYPSGPSTIRSTRANGQDIPTPGTDNLGNFGSNFGQQGAMCFWVKPNWAPERTGRQHTMFDISHSNRWSIYMRHLDSVSDYETYMNRLTPSAAVSEFHRESIDGGQFSLYMHPSRNTTNQTEAYAPSFFFLQPYSIHYWQLPDMTPSQSVVFSMYAAMGDYAFDTPIEISGRGATIPPDQWCYPYFNNYNYLFTETANHKHKTTDTGKYNLDGRRWNYVGMMWNMHDAGRMLLQVNEEQPDPNATHLVPGGRRACWSRKTDEPAIVYDNVAVQASRWRTNWWRNSEPQVTAAESWHVELNDLLFGIFISQVLYFDQFKKLTFENPMRFGAWARDNGNFVADASFDDIAVFANPTGALDPDFLQDRYYYGRYYHEIGAPAAFRTGAFKPVDLMKVAKRERLQLRSLAWTLYVPDDSLDSMEGENLVKGSPNPIWEHDPVRAEWDPMTVDVAVNGQWLYSDDDDDLKPADTPFCDAWGQAVVDDAGDGVYFSHEDTLRLKFYFNDMKDSEFPVHEAPILDDATLTFGFTNPKVLLWQWEK